MESPRTTLNTIPDLSSRRGSRLCTHKAVDSRFQLSELALNEAALSESCAEECGIDSDQDPGASAECDSREEKSAPEEDFENSDESHGCVIVFLDKFANGISSCVWLVGWLGGGRCTCCSGYLLRWLDSWDQVCAGVGCDVEDGVDAEWEHCEGVLGREEPDKSHS